MNMGMKTLILKIDNEINASKIHEVVKLFRGVKLAHFVTPEEEKKNSKTDIKTIEKEDNGLLKAIKESRTGRMVNTEEFIKKLRK